MRISCDNSICRHETTINEKVAWITRLCLTCREKFDWENILTEKKILSNISLNIS